MAEFLPIIVIGAGLYTVLRQESIAAQTPPEVDQDVHPHTLRQRPPPAPLREVIFTPAWGQKRYRPYKAFPAPGSLTDHLFLDPITGQVRIGQQNAGFESI